MGSDKTIIYLLLFISLFSFPVMALTAVFWVFSKPERWEDTWTRMFIYGVFAFAIGWLNTTKPVVGSDIGYYYWLYNFAGTKSLAEFVSLIPKEPAYHLYTYVMQYLTFGHFPTFITVTTMLMYMLVMAGYDLILRSRRDIDMRYAILAALMLVCFVEYFFYTAQIVRQVLAGSVAFYGMARSLFGNDRRPWALLLVILSGFIHASAFIFYIFFIPYFLRDRALLLQVGATLLLLALYATALKFIGGLDIDSDTINVAVSRGLSDSTDKVSVGLLPALICISTLPMSVWLIIRSHRVEAECDEPVESQCRNSNETVFLIFAGVLALFLIINYGNKFFILRFMAYSYMFLPILIVMILSYMRKGLLLSIVIVVALFGRFVLKFGSGDFQYMGLIDYVATGWCMAIL